MSTFYGLSETGLYFRHHRYLLRSIVSWLILLLVLVCTGGPQLSLAQTQCGVERWSVKTGTDPDASSVDVTTSVPTTVAALVALPAPATLPNNQRIEPVETTVWVVDATLSGYKRETDSDYHLVLSDENGNTMIVAIPSLDCVDANSPFFDAIGSARASFDAELHATSTFHTANIPVRVTGVGFFDFLHGQTGVAPNGIELHPVLDIEFNPTTETGTTFFVVVDDARVRECPQTSCSVITRLHPGDAIEVLQAVNGDLVQGSRTWYRIQVNGQDAFVHSSLVTTATPTSTGILDDFDRADGSLGSNWSGSTSGYAIASGQLSVGEGDVYWHTASFGPDQEAYVTLTAINANSREIDLLLKAQSSTYWEDGVLEVWYNPVLNHVQVWTYTSSQDWVQHGADIAVAFQAGDQFGARAKADGTVEVYRNGVLLDSRDVSSWPHYSGGGYIGLWMIGASGTVVDDFGGGPR